MDRIAIMSRSFGPVLKRTAQPDDPKRSLDLLDFADMVAEHYGVHYVELQHSDLPSTEDEYLQEFRNRLQKAKSQINQINIEFGAINVSSPDPVFRLEEWLLADDSLRVEFYDRFSQFARLLAVALSSASFLEETPAARVDKYKADLQFFKTLRTSVRRRYAGHGTPAADKDWAECLL